MTTELAHYGVKGMRWGVTRNRDSSSSSRSGKKSSSGGTRAKASPPKKAMTKKELEAFEVRRQAQIKMGKDITKAVVIAVGTVAIGAVAGPVVAAGAGAVARSIVNGSATQNIRQITAGK